MEHRWGQRMTVDVPVGVRLAGGAVASARIVNVSLSGALIEAESPCTWPGRLELGAADDRFTGHTVRAGVTWAAVEWFELSAARLARILALDASRRVRDPHQVHPTGTRTAVRAVVITVPP